MFRDGMSMSFFRNRDKQKRISFDWELCYSLNLCANLIIGLTNLLRKLEDFQISLLLFARIQFNKISYKEILTVIDLFENLRLYVTFICHVAITESVYAFESQEVKRLQ